MDILMWCEPRWNAMAREGVDALKRNVANRYFANE